MTTNLKERMDSTSFSYLKPMELFKEKDFIKVSAPMVRYSKLAFRKLVRHYDCDLTFTPMIVANSFIKSAKARDTDLTTCFGDRPLIVQFAANNTQDLAHASEIVSPFVDGVDINCGCPQRWAMAEGYGACLLKKSNLLCDMIKQTLARVDNVDFTLSMKIRLLKDLRETVDLCQKVEKMGLSFLTVHGRTKEERCEPVDLDAIRVAKESVQIPVIANGDIRNMDDVHKTIQFTGVDGVMSARGLLANPSLYSGYYETPLHCIKEWVNLALSLGTSFTLFHHHLIMMLEHLLPKAERNIFNSLASTSAVIQFLESNLDIVF